MQKLKGPLNFTGFSFRGNWFQAENNMIEGAIHSVITVPLDAVETAVRHGWSHFEEAIIGKEAEPTLAPTPAKPVPEPALFEGPIEPEVTDSKTKKK